MTEAPKELTAKADENGHIRCRGYEILGCEPGEFAEDLEVGEVFEVISDGGRLIGSYEVTEVVDHIHAPNDGPNFVYVELALVEQE